MVTRIYKCEEHGEFEVESSIKEPVLRNCPQCGRELKRKFSSPDVLFCEVNRNRFNPINPQKSEPIFK
jgi:putative FmdB family regulatory protein